jgi:hypothetical protein
MEPSVSSQLLVDTSSIGVGGGSSTSPRDLVSGVRAVCLPDEELADGGPVRLVFFGGMMID